jgi:hypothetical protein
MTCPPDILFFVHATLPKNSSKDHHVTYDRRGNALLTSCIPKNVAILLDPNLRVCGVAEQV